MTDQPVPERFRPLLSHVIDMVAADDVEGLRHHPRVLLTDCHDPLYWVRDYPATVVKLPEEARQVASYSFPLADGTIWNVRVDLWTAKEGRSDLTLEAEVRDLPDGPTVEILNIHVM